MQKRKGIIPRETLERAVERQMRWRDLLERMSTEALRRREAEELRPQLGPCVTISREAGAGGGEIARLVGEKLGWKVLDKEIVEFMAERFRVDRNILDSLDETKSNWIQETLGALLDHRLISQDAYVAYLGRMMMLAAYQGRVVLVGRGGQFFLPSAAVVAVRIVAPEADRVRHVGEAAGRGEEEARELMNEIEEGRDEFVRRYFRKDITQPDLYDLIINSSSFGFEGSAELIVAACHVRGFADQSQP